MKNVLSFIPPFVLHLIIFIFGIILLLYTLGFFQKGLDKLLIIISLCMIVYGFIELGGIQTCKKLLGSRTNNTQDSSTHSSENNDFNKKI